MEERKSEDEEVEKDNKMDEGDKDLRIIDNKILAYEERNVNVIIK
jgi:hypothetical protein